jgi:ribonuclease Z
MNLLGLKQDLHIFSHSELKNLIQPQLDFIKGEMKINLIFHPLNFKKPQKIFTDKKVEIYSFPVKHSIPTCGFLFKEIEKQANIKKEVIQEYNLPIAKIKEIKAGADFTTIEGRLIKNKELTTPPAPVRSYAYCTDTAYYEPIIDLIKNVDLLYHEATFPEEMSDFAHKTFHSTAKKAAQIAKMAQVNSLIIGHFSARYNDVSIFLKEAKTIFKNTYLAKEGKTYHVLQKKNTI